MSLDSAREDAAAEPAARPRPSRSATLLRRASLASVLLLLALSLTGCGSSDSEGDVPDLAVPAADASTTTAEATTTAMSVGSHGDSLAFDMAPEDSGDEEDRTTPTVTSSSPAPARSTSSPHHYSRRRRKNPKAPTTTKMATTTAATTTTTVPAEDAGDATTSPLIDDSTTTSSLPGVDDSITSSPQDDDEGTTSTTKGAVPSPTPTPAPGAGGSGWPTTADEIPTTFPTDTLSSFRNCYLAAPLVSDLGCKRLNTFRGPEFGLNELGQETSGKRRCLARVRAKGGNTFVFAPQLCEVWRCDSRDGLRASAAPTDKPTPGPVVEGLPAGAQEVSFLSFHGRYLRVASAEGLVDAMGISDAATEGARFGLVRNDDGTVSLYSAGHGYVTAYQNGDLKAEASTIDEWESFRLEENDQGKVALKSFHGFYISAREWGGAQALAPIVDDWELFTMTSFGYVAGKSDTSTEEPEADSSIEVNASLEVFSDLCEFQEMSGGRGGETRRAPVFVKLWEWNYVDIARECREYLGPNGFDAVQISPVAEHIKGADWWTKYQPISFGLETRSGTAEEFKAMVAECRAAGVQVIVDLILNHIATPCGEAYAEGADALPCRGWNGSTYGKRQIGGARGWDAASPEFFHHAEGQPLSGECGVGPPDFLCGSLITTDCSCCRCDMYGMPDWNTDLEEVRSIHFRFVKELHDAGITMLRVDAALYENVTQTASVLNQFPWDYVYMEWWGEFPTGIHDKYIGNYRDVALRWKITDRLASEKDLSKLPEILTIDYGTFGIKNELTVYPIAFHDQRTNTAVQETATYKNGLEYHQQQKFFMAWPWPERILLWGGYGWTDIGQGPPGCEHGQDLCKPTSVFDSETGESRCLGTPTESPMPDEDAQTRRWICEHRWTGVAGLVGFRHACRGLETSVLSGTSPGRLAFTAGNECMVALVRGTNTRWPQGYGNLGDWKLNGLATGLPAGTYCDVSQLSTRFRKGETQCPSKVVIGDDGVVKSGKVKEGDLLAIYTGARLDDDDEQRRLGAGAASANAALASEQPALRGSRH